MKRWLWALLLATQAAAGDPYPRIACYAATAGGGFPLHDGSAYRTATMRHLARFQLITLNTHPWFDFAPGCPDSIRSFRPSGRPLQTILAYDLYGQRFAYATLATMWKAEYDISAANNPLFGQDGVAFPNATNQWPNIGLSFVAQAIDSVWRVYVLGPHKANGVFRDIDDANVSTLNSDTSSPIDATKAGFASGAAMDAARLVNIQASCAMMHGFGAIVVQNGIIDTTSARAMGNGIMYEQWSHFITPPDNNINQAMHGGPYSMMAAYVTLASGNTTDQGKASEVYSAATEKQVRFGLACACMAGAYFSFGANRDLPADGETYLDWWYDEYSVNPSTGKSDSSGQYVGWLGQPKAAAQRDLTTGLWYREFEHGLVLLNTTGTSQQEPLGRITHRRWRRVLGFRDATNNTGKDEACPTIGSFAQGIDTGDALFLVEVSPGQ